MYTSRVSLRPADTSPEAWKVFLDIQRRMTPAEKIERTLEWSQLNRAFAEAGIRQRWPQADDREILLRYARLTLGEELFLKAYGDALPEDEPAGRNA
jgi:hypothetical protein